MQFYVHFMRAKEQGLFGEAPDAVEALTDCPRCGQPTSADGLCAFCRLWEPRG